MPYSDHRMNSYSVNTVSARGSRSSGCRAALDEAHGVLGFDSPKCACVEESEHSARVALAIRDLDGQGVLRLALRAIADRVTPEGQPVPETSSITALSGAVGAGIGGITPGIPGTGPA
ncbi:hypothetical protein FRAHR75_30012 [Frankia sp. Hr75.2]|nr:hypothetical protein FRAHR75_30012 [Frankia sp. Hr75.2]